MNALPTLQQGDHDLPHAVQYVHRLQALIWVVGVSNDLPEAKALTVNGVFDEHTTAALKEVQAHFGITQDGVCGPKTWPALVTGHP